METPPIRIFTASQEQVDAVWRGFCQQTAVTKAEVWLDGGFLFEMVRNDAGPRSIPRAAHQGHTAPPADPAAP
jgi:hypothetical protein